MGLIDYSVEPIPYFSLEEMQCNCGCGLIIFQPELVIATYRVREEWGSPVISNSWTRCYSHNLAEGGELDSYHLFGKGNDLTPEDKSIDRWMYRFELLCRKHFPFVEPHSTFNHCDIRGRRRV